MKKLFSLFALTAIFSIIAVADIRPPDTPKPAPKGKQLEMFIEVTNDVSEPTLIVKKSSAKMLRAALDEAESPDDSTSTIETKPNSSSTQTVVAGMFLSLAFVFGGVWLTRSKPSKTVLGIFLVAMLGSTGALVFANVAPPRIFGINKNLFAEEFQRRAFARGKVRIKIVSDSNPGSDDFKLLIPREN